MCLCVFGGKGTKRRVREGGRVINRSAALASQPTGKPAWQTGRRRRDAAVADALPAARHPAPKDVQGPERRELQNRPCSGKGAGLLLELVGKLGSRDAMSCRCCFKLLFVFTQEMKGSETISKLKYFSLRGRPGWMWIPGGGCCSPRSGTPARSCASAPVTC